MEMQYDAHGFAVYDGGVELRRISLVAFESIAEPEPTTSFHVRYLGAAAVTGV